MTVSVHGSKSFGEVCHKKLIPAPAGVLAGPPPSPTVIFAGSPPEQIVVVPVIATPGINSGSTVTVT